VAREHEKALNCVVEELSDAYTQCNSGTACRRCFAKTYGYDLSAVKNYWFTHGTVCG